MKSWYRQGKHTSLSQRCLMLGLAAPLTVLKAMYLQTGDINAVTSVSVVSCGCDFLCDTSVLLQDNYLG